MIYRWTITVGKCLAGNRIVAGEGASTREPRQPRDRTAWLRELFEWIKYLESGTPEIPIIASGDRQPVPPGGRRDVAIFDGHALAGLVEQPLLLSPLVCH